MNAQKESLKNKLPGFTQAPASPRKVCDENKSIRKKEKKDARVKMLLMEGGSYRAPVEKQ